MLQAQLVKLDGEPMITDLQAARNQLTQGEA